jgi:PAS domain S-box-containing protein
MAAASLVVAAFLAAQLLRRFGITLPPLATLYPAVMLAALWFGLWSGIFATSLSSVLAFIWLFPPYGQLKIDNLSDGIALALYFAVCIAICVVADRYRRNARRLATLRHARTLDETRRQLEDTSAYQQLALDAAEMGAWVHDLSTKNLTWDACCRRGFGFPPEGDVDYQAAIARIAGEDRPCVEAAVKNAIAGIDGGAYHQEFRVVWADGSVHWIASHGRCYFEGSGDARKAVRFVGTHKDITERKRAEEALRESRARLEAALASMTDAVVICDLEGRFTHFNDAFAAFHRFSSKAECASTLPSYPDLFETSFPNGEPAPFEQWPLPRALRGESVTNVEYRLRRKDTGESWIGSYNCEAIRGEDGRIVGAVTTVRDITEQRLAEDLLATTLQRFYTILSNLNAGVLLVTRDNRVEYANPAYCSLFGIEQPPAELAALEAREMIAMIRPAYRDPEEAVARIESIVAQDQMVMAEEVPMRNGRTALRDFVPLTVNGKSYGRLWVHTDITDRKRMELRLRRFYETNLFAILYWKIDGEVVDVNDEFLAMTGYTREDLRAGRLNWAEMTPAEYRQMDEDARRQVRETGVHLPYEKEFIRKDGTRVWGTFWAAAYEDNRNEGVSFIYDISQRKHAEAELQQARLHAERNAAQLEAVFDSVEERLYVCDAAGNLVMANGVARQTYGDGTAAPAVPEMQNFIAVYGLEGRSLPKSEWPISRILRGEHIRAEEIRVRFGGAGQDRILSCNGSPICDANGNILMAVITSSDITERKRAEDELRRSKLEWERTFNSVPDLIAILDNQHRIVRVNQAMAQKLGTPAEECIGRSCFSSVHGLLAPILNCPHSQTLKDCREHVAEVQEERLGGDFLVSTTPLFDDQGAMTGVVHVARNITERKRAEEELKKLYRTLRAISSSNQALLHATDEPAFLKEVCRTILEDCGHAVAWIGFAENDPDRTVRPVAQSGFKEGYIESLTIRWDESELGQGPAGKAIRSGEPALCRNILTDPAFAPWREPTSQRGYNSVVAIPLKGQEGAFGALAIYSRETDAFSQAEIELLTELAGDVEFGIETLRTRAAHARAVEALRESEARFRSVLDDSRDVVYRMNLQTGHYEYVSPSAESIMGFTREELAGLNFEGAVQRVHPDDLATVRSTTMRLNDTGKEEMEYRVQVRDGRYIWLSSRASLIRDDAGRPLYRDGTIRDITAKKLAEEALLRSEKLASVGRMAATISHEINNPLAAVTNLLFLAQWNQELPESVRKNLELADAELKRIAHITQQSLGFYRETNAPALVRIGAVVQSAVDLMKSKIKARRATVQVKSDLDLAVNAVAGELRQVFANLLANSLDAIDEGGIVCLHIARGASPVNGRGVVRVVVADNGRGIGKNSQEHIFEPFFTTKGSVGTGLGLWVTRQIIEKHQGTIRARSATAGARRGTVFVVTLPVAPAAGGADSDTEASLLSTQ